MIDINQWRASIGAFTNAARSVTCTSIDNYHYPYSIDKIHHHYSAVMWFISMYFVLNIYSFICLILSGDIETNPGPVHIQTLSKM